MKHLFSAFFLLTIVFAMLSGCKEERKEKTAISVPKPEKPTVVMQINVPPFYASHPFSIDIGEYGEALKSNDATAIKALAKNFSKDKNGIKIETLYVLAIRLYDLDEKDLATYWFYTAQMRASVFIGMLENPDLGYARTFRTAFNAFSKTAGVYINGHAFGDIPQVRDVMIQVIVDSGDMKPFDQLYPNVSFKDKSQFGKVLKNEANNLRGLIQHTIKNEAKIKADYEKQQFEKKY